MSDQRLGKIMPARALFIREAVGTATADDRKYELERNVDGAPIIKSCETGKTWHIRWHDLIDLAVAAGVDETAVCRECGCTDDDCSGCIERTGTPCHWVERDLCSACAPGETS